MSWEKNLLVPMKLGILKWVMLKIWILLFAILNSIENFKHKDKNELYANEYASELILPTPFIEPYVKKHNISLDLIEDVSMVLLP